MEAGLLVVDDDILACDRMNEILRHLGYHPSFAHCWSHARRRLDEENIEMVLLDESLAHREGEYIIAGMREHGYNQRVVVMSDMADYLLTDWTERGAVEVIKKPASPQRLRETLRSVLSRSMAG